MAGACACAHLRVSVVWPPPSQKTSLNLSFARGHACTVCFHNFIPGKWTETLEL